MARPVSCRCLAKGLAMALLLQPSLLSGVAPAWADTANEPAAPMTLAAEASAPPARSDSTARPAWPARLNLRYRVLLGEDGFTLGRSTYTWQARDGRYTLVSVTEATGVAALLVSGRMVQHSEGRVGPAGLQPELYSLQRSARRKDVARFDWGKGLLRQDSQQGDEPLPSAAQDMLGFPFHLALTLPPRTADFPLHLTNGRTLKEYTFRDLGLEPVKAGGRQVQARHLRGTRPGEGALDVWLDSRGHRLPVMLRSLDDKGKTMTLVAEAMDGQEAARQ